MANNVIVSVMGGDRQIMDNVNTLGDIKRQCGLTNYTGAVNGVTATEDKVLQDGNIVTFSQSVKGGLI